MAKFVVLAREAFTDLIRGLGSKGSGFGPNVQRMFKSFQNNRSKIASHYKKTTGKVVPEGKVVVPSELHRALKQETFVKKGSQRTVKNMADEEKLFERLGNRMEEPREASYTRQQPKRDKGTGRNLVIGKRTLDEGQRRLDLKAEREAARTGKKINRTNRITSRDLDRDTF